MGFLRKIMVSFGGERIDATRQIEEALAPIEKTMGISMNDLDDAQALLLAANQKMISVPELIGVR